MPKTVAIIILTVALALSATVGVLGLSLTLVSADDLFVHPHTHDPLTGEVVVATPESPPTPTPAPAAEPSATVAADVYDCSFHEVRGLTYVAASAHFLVTPHDFGPAPGNEWGYYTATLWLTIEDQDGNEIVRYANLNAVIGAVGTAPYFHARHFETYDFGAGLRYRYKPSHVVDESVTGITCRAGGHFNPLPSEQPESETAR